MFRAFIPIVLAAAAWGATYPVVEPDPVVEISKLAKKVDVKKLLGKARQKVWEYSASYLPPASRNETYFVDPTYCLKRPIEVPITDRENRIKGWKVLYPKGYCFNPVEYLNVKPPPMVVFNPTDKKQLKFVSERLFPRYPNALYILSGISLKTAKKIAKNSFLKRVHWYFLNDFLKKKLNLKATISVVSVNFHKKAIEIDVIKP